MSTAISFLSGKGGSGKTTLALGMADLLCRCGVQTLLVDCDLSTNGATYFYESQLAAQGKNELSGLLSFNSLLNTHSSTSELIPLKIGTKLSFIPSFLDISGHRLEGQTTGKSQNLSQQLNTFLNWARKNYEVILFDCQAGYTDFLPVFLPLMDVALFVMEADSISASSMRNLHLKIGNHLDSQRVYQIFNKTTPEEFEIYSKIVGTFFTNIGTLLFDWKIRQAFSRSQIPDFENTSAKYGLDLCDICKIIFPDKFIHQKLDQLSEQLRCRQLEERRSQMEEKLYKSAHQSQGSLNYSLLPILFTALSLLLAAAGIAIVYFARGRNSFVYFSSESETVLAIAAAVFLTAAMSLFLFTIMRLQENRVEQKGYKWELREINKELEKLNRTQREGKSN